jgi:hypothetical protein
MSIDFNKIIYSKCIPLYPGLDTANYKHAIKREEEDQEGFKQISQFCLTEAERYKHCDRYNPIICHSYKSFCIFHNDFPLTLSNLLKRSKSSNDQQLLFAESCECFFRFKFKCRGCNTEQELKGPMVEGVCCFSFYI